MYTYNSPIRHQSCLAYIPFIALLFFSLFIAGLGVWVHFTLRAFHEVKLGLTALTIDWQSTELTRIRPALVGTAIAQFVMVIILLLLSIWRELVHMRHDRRGFPAATSIALLVINSLFNTLWWLLTVWLVLLVAADFLWALMVFMARQQMKAALTAQDTYGGATYIPGNVCPGQCLDMSNYAWMSNATFTDACLCDRAAIQSASDYFNDAYSPLAAVLAGIWVLYISAELLFANMCCQFALTRKERSIMPKSPEEAVALEHSIYNPGHAAARPLAV